MKIDIECWFHRAARYQYHQSEHVDILDHRKSPPTTPALGDLKRLIRGSFCDCLFLSRFELGPIVLLKPLRVICFPKGGKYLGIVKHVEDSGSPSVSVPVAQIADVDALCRMPKRHAVTVSKK